jgi:2-methylcitrate dehydratase PrpD
VSDTATRTSTTGVSRAIADVLASTRYEDLPADVVEHTRRSITDWLGSALGGCTERPARLAQHVAAGLGVSNESTIFGAGRASAAAAAFANGVASHILELDDIHKGSTVHAAAPIIPAALAVAEREHVDGRAFMTAVTLGYEAAFRIGEAVNPSHYFFFHPTGTVATFGAAVAAGSILKLTPGQMLDALGSAGTQAAALWEFNADGAMSKHLHPGKAAMNGVLAADLARAGFTGATRILEGERGFFRAMSTTHDPTRVSDGLGRRWKIGENGYKLHACCGHTHTAVDCALEIRLRRNWREADVVAAVGGVEIETYGPGYEIVKEMQPRTPYQAKFSLAYCVCAALLEGSLGLGQFASERFGMDGVRAQTIAELLRRTRVVVATDLTAKYPAAWPARVVVRLADGSVDRAASDFPRGHAENPVTTAELEAKFSSLVGSRFGDTVARAALVALHAVDRCTDMSVLLVEMGRLAPVAGQLVTER